MESLNCLNTKNRKSKRNKIPFLSVLCGPKLNASVFQLWRLIVSHCVFSPVFRRHLVQPWAVLPPPGLIFLGLFFGILRTWPQQGLFVSFGPNSRPWPDGDRRRPNERCRPQPARSAHRRHPKWYHCPQWCWGWSSSCRYFWRGPGKNGKNKKSFTLDTNQHAITFVNNSLWYSVCCKNVNICMLQVEWVKLGFVEDKWVYYKHFLLSTAKPC